MEEALSVKIKNPKSYTELMDSIPEKDRKCVEIMNKQSAEALEERLSRLQHVEWEKRHNLTSVYPKVEWS